MYLIVQADVQILNGMVITVSCADLQIMHQYKFVLFTNVFILVYPGSS